MTFYLRINRRALLARGQCAKRSWENGYLTSMTAYRRKIEEKKRQQGLFGSAEHFGMQILIAHSTKM